MPTCLVDRLDCPKPTNKKLAAKQEAKYIPKQCTAFANCTTGASHRRRHPIKLCRLYNEFTCTVMDGIANTLVHAADMGRCCERFGDNTSSNVR